MLTTASYGGGLSFPSDDATSSTASTDSRARTPVSGWSVTALAVAAVVCLPLLAVIWLAFTPEENIWPHLYRTVLGNYVSTTLLLMLGVALGTFFIGVSSAWVVTHYEFPLRKVFNWALLLPFAVPAYVIAYVYSDLLEYAGPVQSSLRTLFGWQLASDYYFPDIRTLPGAIIMMTLVLYPYVYLLSRAAFLEQSASLAEAARSLGVTRCTRILKVSLPMARPAIAVGLALVMMETLNDFGTVDYFAVRTLTAGLYDVWLGMNNLGGGAQIATLLLIFVLMLIGLEKSSRRYQQHYLPSGSRFRPLPRRSLHGLSALSAFLICAIPVVFGFVVPALVLVLHVVDNLSSSLSANFIQSAANSVMLSSIASLCAVTLGVLLSYSKRLHPTKTLHTAVGVASLGYAIPGAVLAIGVIIPLAAFDNEVDSLMRSLFGISTGLLLSGTVFALIFAYTVRFLAMAYGSINASMSKISPHMDDAARSLGKRPGAILRTVHLPLMRGGLLTAALVVFVDCMKELPATLVLRPFNFDTLATQVYQYASDELIGQSAIYALLIVLVGLLPVVLLSTTIDRTRSFKSTD